MTTLYGPSIRTLSKLVIPKFRLAAPAGAASDSVAAAAVRKVRIGPPSTFMVKGALRTADVAGSRLGHRALCSAGHVDVARSHNVDFGAGRCVGPDATGARNRDLGLLGIYSRGVDPARSGDLIFGDPGLA